MSLTPTQLATLDLIVRSTSAVAAIGDLSIIVDHVRRWRKKRESASRIIVWGCVASLLAALTFLPGQSFVPQRGEPPSIWCLTQAVIQQYSIHASHMWFLLQTIVIFLVMWGQVHLKTIQWFEPLYHFVAWTVPLFTTFGPAIQFPLAQFYGDAGLWCWIGPMFVPYRVSLSILVIWSITGFSTALYVLVWWRLRHDIRRVRMDAAQYSRGSGFIRQGQLRPEALFAIKTGAFMITYIFSYSGASANRIHALVSPPSPFWVITWQAVTMTGTGLWNAVTYFGVPRLLRHLRAQGIDSDMGCTSTVDDVSWNVVTNLDIQVAPSRAVSTKGSLINGNPAGGWSIANTTDRGTMKGTSNKGTDTTRQSNTSSTVALKTTECQPETDKQC